MNFKLGNLRSSRNYELALSDFAVKRELVSRENLIDSDVVST